jgi:hypothetical protein
MFLGHFMVCRGEDLYLKMLVEDNLVHADLHPGNILIQNHLKSQSTLYQSVLHMLSTAVSLPFLPAIVIVQRFYQKLFPKKMTKKFIHEFFDKLIFLNDKTKKFGKRKFQIVKNTKIITNLILVDAGK